MPLLHTNVSRLLKIAETGPFRARDLDRYGIPRAYLKRLSDRGLIERVDRGLYRSAKAPASELHTLAEACKRVPHMTICLLSALQVHCLTTESPHAVWGMIETRARTPKVAYPPLVIVRASGSAWTYGVESRTVEGATVRVTTPAKTVADCFRYRNDVGLETALLALKDYLRKYRAGVGNLTTAARADGIYTVMKPYLEALV